MLKQIILFLIICSCLYSISYAALVAEWKFEEGSGITTADTSGNNYTGTLVNGTAWTNGKVGKGLQFDGLDDSVNYGTDSSLNVSSITISAWVFATDDTAYLTIASKHGESGQYGWALRRANDRDAVEFGISSNGTDWLTFATSNDSFETNVWYHITATSDGQVMRVYINGIENTGGDFSHTFTTSGTSIYANIATFEVGTSCAQNLFMKGIIDEVKLYNNALNASEVLALYNSYLPDSASPTITITNPANSAIVSGTISFSANASDDKSVKQVDFYVDNILKYIDSSSPYAWNWNTTGYSNGTHTIKAVVTDTSDKTADAQISVTVSNAAISDDKITIEVKPTDTVINPMTGQSSKINFSIPKNNTSTSGNTVHVVIAIYNTRDELVKTLIDQDMPEGQYQAIWNGRSFEEDVVASGVYLIRLRAGTYTATKKIAVIK
ncbi:MAG: hypothetical protein A2539_09635 [Elusimicrobia bacterium RIFOXYD2_FULL_34_15]|nr:MAG: hypothetical protein A2539_09635 [Elusimicrobia bacterium RIFOXYD2_FULL_34_15]